MYYQQHLVDFYPNVTTLRLVFAIANPSVSLSSVTFMQPTQPVEIFGNVSTPFFYLNRLVQHEIKLM